MLSVSQAYKELVNLSIRPKCEPTITATWVDENGDSHSVVWEAKDITKVQYKRGADPLGRELPFMELSWTEIYNGLYNEENMPYKYSSDMNYATVELTFNQALEFYNTWGLLKKSDYTWKKSQEIFETWGAAKDSQAIEKIKLPKLFLEATPTVENKKIKWVAKDILSFMKGNFTKLIYSFVDWKEPLLFMLAESRANFAQCKNMVSVINSSIKNASAIDTSSDLFYLGENVMLDGKINELLANWVKMQNIWIDFAEDGSLTFRGDLVGKPISSEISQKITGDIMYENAKITKGKDVSIYSFNKYLTEEDGTEYKSTPIAIKIDGISGYYRHGFKGLSNAYNGSNQVTSELTYTIAGEDSLTVRPLETNQYSFKITTGLSGDEYNEDNPANTYDNSWDGIGARLAFIQSFLSKDLCDMTISSLSNVALEPSDIVNVQTEFYKNNAGTMERVYKNGYIKSISFSYDGALKQELRVGEYDI